MLIGYLHRMQGQLRIGSRASALAVRQAEMVKEALLRVSPGLEITIHTMTTQGDRETGKTLAQWGYKGLFTKELEDAMTAREIDIAVHSMKDMPSILPDGLTIAAMLPRDDVRDAWISPMHADFDYIPAGAIIGTASLRRSAQVRLLHPSVQIVPLRGNVQTRLKKLADGAAEASFLACAGLDRLNMADVITQRIPISHMLPAVAQGAIGIEARNADDAVLALMQKISHEPTMQAVACERAMLRVLDGSCRTPIAGHALIEAGRIRLQAQVIAPDGSADAKAEGDVAIADGEALGTEIGHQLKATVPSAWISAA